MPRADLFPDGGDRREVLGAEPQASLRLCRTLGLVAQPASVTNAARYVDHARSRPTELRRLDIGLTGACFPYRGGVPFFDEAVYPGYLRGLLEASPGLAGQRRQAAGHRAEEALGDEVFLFYHPNCNNFGHFLIESLPKLLTIKHAVGAGAPLCLVVPANAPAFVERYLDALLPDWPRVRLESGHCYRARFVSATIDPLYKYHPGLIGWFRAEAAAARAWLKDRLPPAERLFVSRSGVGPSYRRLANAGRIEEIAWARGLTVVQPEHFTPAEQMALFASARLIVGEYGSGLHNALYAPEGAVVVSINWINLVQQAIGASCGQIVEFITPVEGGYVIDHTAASEATYAVDESLFEHVLAAALERSGPVETQRAAV